MRVEARRQRELEEGSPPEVLLESFLELLKHKMRLPPELPKRVLTSAAKVAKHRRAKDKRRPETPCWWIANGMKCFKRDQCAFKHLMTQVQEHIQSKTGVSSPSLATDCDEDRTKVHLHRPVTQSVSQSSATPDFQESIAKSIPGPSVAPELQESVAKSSSRLSTTPGFQRLVAESVPHVPSSSEFRDTAVSAPCPSEEPELEQNFGRDYWIKVWDECSSSDSLFDDCSDDSPRGVDTQHEFNNDAGWHSDHWKRDSWHSSHCWTTEDHWKHDSWHSNHWRTSEWPRKDRSFHDCEGTWNICIGCHSWNSSHWKTIGWDQKDEHHHGHTETPWFTHAFFEALSVKQLINSLRQGQGDATTFTGLEVDPG